MEQPRKRYRQAEDELEGTSEAEDRFWQQLTALEEQAASCFLSELRNMTQSFGALLNSFGLSADSSDCCLSMGGCAAMRSTYLSKSARLLKLNHDLQRYTHLPCQMFIKMHPCSH